MNVKNRITFMLQYKAVCPYLNVHTFEFIIYVRKGNTICVCYNTLWQTCSHLLESSLTHTHTQTHTYKHPVHQVYTRTKWIPTAHTLIMTWKMPLWWHWGPTCQGRTRQNQERSVGFLGSLTQVFAQLLFWIKAPQWYFFFFLFNFAESLNSTRAETVSCGFVNHHVSDKFNILETN